LSKAQALESSIHVFSSNSELFKDPWEILFDDISLNRIVGEGAFGKVYSGRLLKQTMKIGKEKKSSQRKTDKKQQEMKMGLTVAVKMLQSMICFADQLYVDVCSFFYFLLNTDHYKRDISFCVIITAKQMISKRHAVKCSLFLKLCELHYPV